LRLRAGTVDAALSGVQLTPDEQALAFCTYRHEVGFIDAATLHVTAKIDLGAGVPELADTAYCRLTRVGDDAYAFFYPRDVGGKVAAIARLSLRDRKLMGAWRLASDDGHPVRADFVQTYQGLVEVAGSLVVSGAYEQAPALGPELRFFDAASGSVSRRVFPDGHRTQATRVVASLGAGRVLGSSADGQGEGRDWILDVSTGVFTAVDPAYSGNTTVEVDASHGRMILGYTPSRGFDVRATATGAVVTHLAYPDPGFDTTLRFLADGRIAYLATGSQSSYMSVIDAAGQSLAHATLPGPDVLDAVVSADGARMFAVGTNQITEIEVPRTFEERSR
jgi:hypothetical protein